MQRVALALGVWSTTVLGPACTVRGEEVATTFFDPSAPGEGDPSSGEADTDPTSGTPTAEASSSAGEGTTDADSSGSPPADEQPASGMYSACMGKSDCVGLTTCVIVPSTTGGFCSNDTCAEPAEDCLEPPGASSTAIPTCVDVDTGQSCALDCSEGRACPGGMDCLPLGAAMVCT